MSYVTNAERFGIEKGMEQGAVQEARSLILRQLNRRVGLIAPAQKTTIRNLSLELLEELGEALLDFTVASDLEDWLQSHS